MGLAVAAMLVAPDGHAQDLAAPAAPGERSPPELSAASAAISRPAPLGDELPLRASSTLGKPLPARARRSAFESGEPDQARSAAAAKLPGLRLQSSPSWQLPSVAGRAKPALTAGELNRDGLVRANRMQVRDGTIFLEGGGRADMPAPASTELGNPESRLEAR
jgi:hypothetical protein